MYNVTESGVVKGTAGAFLNFMSRDRFCGISCVVRTIEACSNALSRLTSFHTDNVLILTSCEAPSSFLPPNSYIIYIFSPSDILASFVARNA